MHQKKNGKSPTFHFINHCKIRLLQESTPVKKKSGDGSTASNCRTIKKENIKKKTKMLSNKISEYMKGEST